jgi:hypothetical protein
MTVLRRAPREVYRVFGEDEFLARVADHRDIEPAAPASAQRLLHRVAGTTMLLAAAGMVGGLVALTSLSSGTGTGTRRRIVAGLLAANGSRSAHPRPSVRLAPAEVWREAAGARRYHRRGAQERTSSRERALRRASRPTQRSLDRPEPPVITADRTVPVADEAQTRSAPIDAVTSTSSAGATAVASQPRRSGQPEFGFER